MTLDVEQIRRDAEFYDSTVAEVLLSVHCLDLLAEVERLQALARPGGQSR